MNEVFMEMIKRGLIFYFLLLFIFRFLGKRQVGELGIFDIIVVLIVADISVLAIEATDIPAYNFVAVICIIAILERILAKLSLKSVKIRKAVDGSETFIVGKGKVYIKNMKKESFTFDDLISTMRTKEVTSIFEVDYLILETTGEISIIKKSSNKKALPIPLIISGCFNKQIETLYGVKQSEIEEKLNGKKIKDIYYAELSIHHEILIPVFLEEKIKL